MTRHAPDALGARCRRDYYPAFHSSGSRRLSVVSLVVLHSTEGGTALSNARYFRSPSSGGSAHIVVDELECQRCLPDTAIPWAAPDANRIGFHIEQAGYAAWTRAEWLGPHRAVLERAAVKAAQACRRFGIRPVFRAAPALRDGRSGITTHAECTLAFGPPGGHTDPGAGWPRDVFMRLVRRTLE